MRLRTRKLTRRLDRLLTSTARAGGALAKYRDNPGGYARDVLGVVLWDRQEMILRSLLESPYRTLVESGHSVGKTFLAAVAVNWWYDTRCPGVALSTAPTKRDVEDLLWAEVRQQRRNAGLPDHFIGDSAPEMRTAPDHYAKGFTARKGESFQGRHPRYLLLAFDESEGVEAPYWVTARTMVKPEPGHAWLAICNPTTTTSAAYLETRSTDVRGEPTWKRFQLSCLDHPNITDQLNGREPGIPSAVTVGQLESMIADWCDPVAPGDEQPTDIEWPPAWAEDYCRRMGLTPRRYRPGPIAEPRILGLRPSGNTFGVWSEALWKLVERELPLPGPDVLPEVGCDVARRGHNSTVFHARCGAVSIRHESVNGWTVDKTAGRLIQFAQDLADWATARRDRAAQPANPKDVPLKVDDDGVGGGVTDFVRVQGYNVVPINGASRPRRPDLYPNTRSEAWFMAARKAYAGMMSLHLIDKVRRAKIQQQALAPEWKPTLDGRRQVERKEDTEKRLGGQLGRSPDDMDAVNLAYYEPADMAVASPVDVRKPSAIPGPGKSRPSAARDRGMWGMQ